MSLGMVATGLVGAGLSGYLVDKTGAFLTIFKICFIGATSGMVWFMFMIKENNLPLLIASCAATGFFAFAGLPVGLELCVECTYPVHEGLSAGLIWIFAQSVSIAIIFSSNALRGEEKFYNGSHPVPDPTPTEIPDLDKYYEYPHAVLLCVCITALATLITLVFKTDYKRQNSEKAYNKTHPGPSAVASVQSTA